MFSRQMIALSIIGPMARVNPARVMTLIVCPEGIRSQMQAERTEIGSVNTAIAVIRHWPRKSRIVQRAEDRAQHASWDEARDRLADEDGLVHDELQVDPCRRVSRPVNSSRLALRTHVDDGQGARPELAEDGDIHLACGR